MSEVTRVPLQPIARGSLSKMWLVVLLAIVVAAGAAWLAKPNSVSVEVIREGIGENPTAEDVVFVKYVGKLAATGEEFDKSQESNWPVPGILPDGAALALEQVVPGFRDGLMQMKKGGSYIVTIPAALGYGDSPPPGAPIPAGADLIFEVDLVDFMGREEAEQRYQAMMQAMQQFQQMQGAEGGAAGPAGTPVGPAGVGAPAPQ